MALRAAPAAWPNPRTLTSMNPPRLDNAAGTFIGVDPPWQMSDIQVPARSTKAPGECGDSRDPNDCFPPPRETATGRVYQFDV